MWNEATVDLPDNLEDMAKKKQMYGTEVFCLVDGIPGIGIFMFYASRTKTYFTYETLRTNKQTIDSSDFHRVKWMHIPK